MLASTIIFFEDTSCLFSASLLASEYPGVSEQLDIQELCDSG